MDLILLLITAVFLVVVYLWFGQRDSRIPPSPMRPLPIVGHIFFLQPDSRAQFKKWREELGDLFSFYMGWKLAVVVNGYDLLKEIFIANGDYSSGRPAMFLDEATRIPFKGVIMSSGQPWKEQRAVTMSILREFGMGKNILAEKIQEEARYYMDVLASFQGKPTNLRVATNICMSNVVCSVIIGQRFQYNDESFKDLMDTIDSIVADFDASNYATFIPATRYLPGDLFKIKRIQASIRKIMDQFIKKFVDSKIHGELHNEDNFITSYMNEWKRRIQSGMATSMDEDHLVKILWDLFNAGTETAATTLLWCILFAINYPDIQDKIYAEIKSEIGTEREPTMHDKSKLIYLSAFIMECQRLSSVAALSFPHETTADLTIRNFTIPKGTYLIPNLDSVCYDKKIWGEDADKLRPERFIDENGKLRIPEEFIPFGLGRRVCPGESWAKMVLFLFLAAMVQRFKFVPENPASPPPATYVFGLDVYPTPFEVKVLDRRMGQ